MALNAAARIRDAMKGTAAKTRENATPPLITGLGLSQQDGAALAESLKGLTPQQILGDKLLGDIDAGIASRKKAADFKDNYLQDDYFLNPELQKNPYLLGASAEAGVEADPEMVSRQRDALDQLLGVARGGGATAQERARRAKARGESENWLRGQREADMENLNERGMAGSGAEILNLAKDRQDAAQRLSAADLQTDADLEARALSAMMQSGELAGQLRNTDWNEKTARAGAKDRRDEGNLMLLNEADSDNIDFRRSGAEGGIERQNNWDTLMAQLGLQTAGGLLSSNVGQGQFGTNWGTGVATTDTGAANAGLAGKNALLTGGRSPQYYQLKNEATGNIFKAGEATGGLMDEFASWGFGGPPGGAGGGGGGGGAPGGNTWAGGGNYQPNTGGVTAPTPGDVTGKKKDEEGY